MNIKVCRHSRKGFTLSALIIFIAIAIVLGVTLLFISTNEFSSSIREQNRIKSYYIARAGVDAVASYLNSAGLDRGYIGDFIDNNKVEPLTGTSFGNGEFYIHVDGNWQHPVIYSRSRYPLTGTLQSERVVSLELIKNSFFDRAITTNGLMTVTASNPTVVGGIALVNGGTIVPPDWGDPVSYNTPDPSHILPPYSDSDDISDFKPTKPVNPLDPPDPDLIEYHPEKYGKCDYYLNTDEIENKTVYFDTLTIQGTNNEIILVGGSNGDILKLYVSNLNFKGVLKTENGVKVVIYVVDGGTLNYQTGSGDFNAYVLAPYATVNLTANMTGVGSIYAMQVNLGSGGGITYNSASGTLYPEDLGFPSMGYRADILRTK